MNKSQPKLVKVELSEPIVRGETKIEAVQLREPSSGELRGISMVDLIQLKADTVHELLPRITEPVLTDDEVKGLKLSDFFALSSEVANFLVPESATGASRTA